MSPSNSLHLYWKCLSYFYYTYLRVLIYSCSQRICKNIFLSSFNTPFHKLIINWLLNKISRCYDTTLALMVEHTVVCKLNGHVHCKGNVYIRAEMFSEAYTRACVHIHSPWRDDWVIKCTWSSACVLELNSQCPWEMGHSLLSLLPQDLWSNMWANCSEEVLENGKLETVSCGAQ